MRPRADRKIAAAHLSQESFNLLKDKAAFSARDVVTLAHFANTQHIDANGLAHTLARNNGIIAGNNPNLLRQIRDAETQYMANPDSPEAKERLRRTMMEAAGNDPKKIKAAQENLEKLKAQQRRELENKNNRQRDRNNEQRDRNTAQTERNTAQTDKKRDTTAINNLNALAPQSAATPSPQRPDPAKKTPRAVKAPA